MKPIFAFLLMGAQYDPETHQAHFETESKHTYIYTVQKLGAGQGPGGRPGCPGLRGH